VQLQPREEHQDRRPNRPSPVREEHQEIPKEEPAPVDPQKEFFEWAKTQRHKDTWVMNRKALIDAPRAQRILASEGSKILIEGFNQSEGDTEMIELRAEVQLSRGKVSNPLRKMELDDRTKPADEELKNGRKSVVTKIVVLTGTQVFPSEVNGEKHPLFPVLILRGILEHKEGSKDQEKAAERAKSYFFMPTYPGQLMLPPGQAF